MNSEEKQDSGEKSEADDRSETDADASGDDDYKVDERQRGERPDNLRRRSEWFKKRTGGE